MGKEMGIKEVTIYDSSAVKKLLKTLRGQLKSNGISLRVYGKITYVGDCHQQVLSLSGLTYRSTEVVIEYNKPYVLSVKIRNMDSRNYHAASICQYLLALARELNVKAISLKQPKYFEKEWELIYLDELTLSGEKKWAFLVENAYSPDETQCFLELEDRFIANTSALYDVVSEKIAEIRKEDVTFETVGFRYSGFVLRFTYYYKGFQGNVLIEPNNLFQMKVPELDYQKMLSVPNQFSEVMDEILDESFHRVKLVNLIKPPQKYFSALFSSTIVRYPEVVERAFSLLSEEIDPEEIEQKCAAKTVKIVRVVHQIRGTDYIIFSMLDRFFVTHHKHIDMFHSYEKAKEYFERVTIQGELDYHKSRMQSLETVMGNLDKNLKQE